MLNAIRASLGLLSGRQRAIFFLFVGIRVLINFLDVIGLAAVGLLGAMLASGLTDRSDATFLGYSVTITSSRDFLIMVSLIAAFFIGKSVLATVFLRFTTMFLARVESKIATEVVRFIYSGSLSRMRRFSSGDLQWAASSSANQATSGILSAFATMMTESALFLGVFAVFVVVDASTALVITTYFLVLVVLFQLSINQRLKRLGGRLHLHSVGYVDAITDLTTAFREITVLGVRERFLTSFRFHRSRASLDVALQNFLFGLPRFFVESSLMVGILALVAYQFARGTLSDGLVTTAVFLTGGVRMMAALLPLQNAFANLKTNAPQAEIAQRLVAEARTSTEVSSPQESFVVQPKAPLNLEGPLSVTVKDVTFTHEDGDEPVLRSLSLEVPPGRFVAFIGPSGAGKTTLVDLILGLNTPNQGEVALSGYAPVDVVASRQGAIAYVPQSPGMVAGTIAQNVALGVEPDRIDKDRVWQCLRYAELSGFVERLPNGIHTSLGRQADALSGGQKQRLGLARALYTSPQLIVLDEATSALDASTEASISDTVTALKSQATLIVIAHRLSTVQHADSIYVVEQGKILTEGTFSEVRKKVPMIEEYVRLMSFDRDDA